MEGRQPGERGGGLLGRGEVSIARRGIGATYDGARAGIRAREASDGEGAVEEGGLRLQLHPVKRI